MVACLLLLQPLMIQAAPPVAQTLSPSPTTSLSSTKTYPIKCSDQLHCLLVDLTLPYPWRAQDPLLTLQGLFLLSSVACNQRPADEVITDVATTTTEAMQLTVTSDSSPDRPVWTWGIVCAAVRGMGEYVAERRLWYKLKFDLFEDDGRGRLGDVYGSLSTEVIGSVGAGRISGGRANGTGGGVAVD
ncbi:MAG: hypothetical protein OHK93_001237 [Ramalina farinacea]|uniref:Uncharacterized protein n=1 Tax=Ramalina farinacea TaxID=258253 RepID=A0AA43TW07_9LECA|nr:hypothetical protein [Ramalina farinacea]